MSTPVFVNAGELDTLETCRAANTYTLRLFKSNTTILATTVIGDLTEADYSGYAAQTLVYGAPATNGSGQGAMTAAELTFTRGVGVTSNDVYGYMITNNAGFGSPPDVLIKAEKFDAPVPLNLVGDNIKITDTFLGAGTIV